jgi:hypothetical protein
MNINCYDSRFIATEQLDALHQAIIEAEELGWIAKYGVIETIRNGVTYYSQMLTKDREA